MAIRLAGEIGEPPNTAADVAAQLAQAGGAPVAVIVNSPGGLATEGAAIHAELRAYPGRVRVAIRGIAASAASLAAMAGDEIAIAEGAVFMLHDPAALTFGPAEAHRHTAGVLDVLSETYAQAYAEASGNRLELVRAWMREEAWLGAQEAVALGFADRIEEAGAAPEHAAAAA